MTGKLKWYFKGVKEVYKNLYGRLKVFQESVKCISQHFPGCFNKNQRVSKGSLSGFQGYLEEFLREFQESFTCVSRKFQGCSKKVQTLCDPGGF